MALAKDYASVMGRSNEIQKKALGLDYEEFETSPIAYDYDKLMTSTDYTLEEVNREQSQETSQSWQESTRSRALALVSSSRTKLRIRPVLSRTEELPALFTTLRSWVTRALWLLHPVTMVLLLLPRLRSRD